MEYSKRVGLCNSCIVYVAIRQCTFVLCVFVIIVVFILLRFCFDLGLGRLGDLPSTHFVATVMNCDITLATFIVFTSICVRPITHAFNRGILCR